MDCTKCDCFDFDLGGCTIPTPDLVYACPDYESNYDDEEKEVIINYKEK